MPKLQVRQPVLVALEFEPFSYRGGEDGDDAALWRVAPRLGPVLTLLIMHLRRRARGGLVLATQAELGEAIGVSRWTIMREVRRREARDYIKVRYRSRHDATKGLTYRIQSAYGIAMDAPPESEQNA